MAAIKPSELNLHQKLVEVRKVIPYLQKEKEGSQFKYVGSSQVLSQVVAKLNELNVLLVPRVVGTHIRESAIEQYDKDGHVFKRTTTYFTELTMTMTWVNADNPTETIECPWYGQGVDIAGEKGVGKALTYAEKYFMLKFFNIATDKDDPDSFQEKAGGTQPEKTDAGKTTSKSKPAEQPPVSNTKPINKDEIQKLVATIMKRMPEGLTPDVIKIIQDSIIAGSATTHKNIRNEKGQLDYAQLTRAEFDTMCAVFEGDWQKTYMKIAEKETGAA